jgi:hypothetical protein
LVLFIARGWRGCGGRGYGTRLTTTHERQGFLTGPPGEWFPPLAPEDLIHELCKKIMQRQMRQDWKLRLMISSRPCKSTAITWIVWPPITS